MENTYLMAGFGGQGVQTLGQLLTYAATDAGKCNVSSGLRRRDARRNIELYGKNQR